MKNKIFALSGVAAAVIYVCAVIIGAAITPGYSHVTHAISELIAAGAPNKTTLDVLFVIYNGFVLLFGFGLIKGVKGEGIKKGRIGSVALILTGALGIILTLFFPMDPRGAEVTFPGTMHLVVAGLLSLGTMISVLYMGIAFRKDKRWSKYSLYSFITLSIIFITGGISAVSAGTHSPLMGAFERMTIGSFLQWIFVASLKLKSIDKREQLKAKVGVSNS